MKTIHLNNSLKAHLLLSVVISLWLLFFLIVIAPFDISELTFESRLELMPAYGVLFFFSYLFALLVQFLLFNKSKTWNIWKEAWVLSTIYLITPFLYFPYYSSLLVKGDYDFTTFSLTVYLPIALIITPILIFGRMYLNKLQAKKVQKKITLKGSNKTDVLKIAPEDLVCISSAQNYVEIHYMQQGKLQKELLRNTLKNIQDNAPSLIQVHRSHLVNPSYFVKWINSSTVQIHDLEISISKKYKDAFSQSI